ncbi:MAG: c-type cytochrome [Bacteroidota bacterium]
MAVNFLILAFVIGLAIFFGWLTRKAWRLGNPILKWAGVVVGSLSTLLISLVALLGLVGIFRYYNPPLRAAPGVQVTGTQKQIERGRHLAAAFCVECHSTTRDFPMTGGVDVGKDLPVDLGAFYSANLTPAGPLKNWTDGEIFRALRDNVDKDGKRLAMMAGTNVRSISDEDLIAIIAFLRSQEAVANEPPRPLDQPNFLAVLMSGASLIPDRPLVEGPIAAPAKEPTAEYGQFMTTFLDCKSCHGQNLSGGDSPIGPKGPSLRVVKGWSQEQFITTLRTGVDPTGHQLSPLMPWRSTGRLDDVELSALYQYLIGLE